MVFVRLVMKKVDGKKCCECCCGCCVCEAGRDKFADLPPPKIEDL